MSFIVDVAEIGWGYSRMLAEETAHIWTVTLLEFIRNLSQEVLSARQRHSVS